MGEVYEAAHARLAHRYAVKFLHPGVRDHPEALPRFMREAQITSRLRHPGIVSVVDFDTLPTGLAYLVMEFLEGESLGKLLRRSGPLPLSRVVDITDQISSALSAAHLQGVVHRDMHPQNIFVVPGTGGQSDRIKILDFGISKIASISQKITGMAAVMGTPQYMSPEQAEGKADELDASSDQFSLAAIVYEMLAGRAAFSGETLASIAYQIVHAQPPGVRTYRPELPVEMENVIARGLSKNKKDRFPSVSEFAVHLRWTATLPPSEVPSKLPAVQSAPTAYGFDKEETTAVSKLPSDMAAVLRKTSSGLSPQKKPLSAADRTPAVAPADDRTPAAMRAEDRTPAVVPADDESTIVSPSAGDEGATVVNGPEVANPTVIGRPQGAPRPPTVVSPPAVLRPAALANAPLRTSPTVANLAAALNPPTVNSDAALGTPPPVRYGPGASGLPAPGSRRSAVHELTVMDVPRRRLAVIGTAVASGLLAVVIVIGVVARSGRTRSDPPAGPATAPIADSPNAPGAPAAAPAGAVSPPRPPPDQPPPPSPAAHPSPAPATDREAAPATEAAAAGPEPVPSPTTEAGGKRTPGRDHAHTAGRAKQPAAVRMPESTPTTASEGGQCHITVGTYPWSDLWVDGADTGQHTPVVGLPVTCGAHRLEFRRRDLKIDQIETVTVTEGREFKRQYELQGSGVDE